MTDRLLVREGAYRDSVKLMLASQRAAETEGVTAAVVAMATALNLDLLERRGFGLPQPPPTPDDLVLAIRGDSEAAIDAALAAVDRELSTTSRPTPANAVRPGAARNAIRQHPDLNLAFVSVPGTNAALEVALALDAGLHVLCFSDGIPLAAEVALKQRAAEQNLLLMGPDCGTSLIDGVALGFANALEPGPVGVVGASGSGIQELTCLLDSAGVGVSHAIGVGGRDLSEAVGGVMTIQALDRLADDTATEAIVVVTKPPSVAVLERVRAHGAGLGKPVSFAFPGSRETAGDSSGRRTLSGSIEQAAESIASRFGAQLPSVDFDLASERRGGFVRGLFCGGTLALEVSALLAEVRAPVRSNVPLRPEWALDDPAMSDGHTVIDFGEDGLTEGRPHPIIDPSLRLERLRRERKDPAVAAILLDVILGFGAHSDPASELVPEIAQAVAERDDLTVVISVCGTDRDSQDLSRQMERLRKAGAHVTRSSAALARAALTVVAPERSYERT